MVLTTEPHGTTRKRGFVAPCPTGRNLINLILHGKHTSRFSEINYHRSYVAESLVKRKNRTTTEGQLSAGIFKTTERHGTARKRHGIGEEAERKRRGSEGRL